MGEPMPGSEVGFSQLQLVKVRRLPKGSLTERSRLFQGVSSMPGLAYLYCLAWSCWWKASMSVVSIRMAAPGLQSPWCSER